MSISLRIYSAIVVATFFFAIAAPTFAFQAKVAGAKPIENVATLLRVDFPLTTSNEARIIESLERLGGRGKGADRPIVVLEFVGKQDALTNFDEVIIGRGTDFVRALGLARWLSGPKGRSIRSVAYIPQSICGHAVLVALGCEEVAIASAAKIALAGIDEPVIDTTVKQAYIDEIGRAHV